MDQFTNKTRPVRVDLTKEQIEELILYAMKHGFQRKRPTHTWDLGEQNRAAKWAMLHILATMNIG